MHKDIQAFLQGFLGGALIMSGIFLGAYLVLYVLLYGGIMQALNNWGSDNSVVAWGIIKAIFCSLGAIPGYLLAFAGIEVLKA